MPDHARPDVSDMYAVHGVFRDTLGAVPRLVGGIDPDDAERVALIANYYDNVLSFLEAHHDSEEVLVVPLLRERCAGEGELVDRMAEQHHEAIRLLEEARGSLSAWQTGDAASQKAAEDALLALHAQLLVHLDDEEAQVLPLAEANLSPEEWGALPGHGLGHFEGDKIWLILGLIRQRMNDGQRAAMLENMPPPAVDMWTGFGEQAFKDYSQVVVVEVTGR
ncbi:MAG: hemerythrin domain-containing protein [Acidimicrobiales bacterium]